MKKIVFFLFALCLVLGSCSSKMDPLSELTVLAEEIDENGSNYTNEDWNHAVQQYEAIEQELDQYTYTDEEQKEIGRLKAKLGYKFAIKFGKNKLKQIINEMAGAVEELSNIDSTEVMNDLFGNE